jgi:GLPGLI family protein
MIADETITLIKIAIMKKQVGVFILLAFILFGKEKLFAQNEGVITYEITVNNHRNIPADREGMKAMVPQYRTFKQRLFFDSSASLYKPLIEDEEDDQQRGGRRFRMGAVNYSERSSSLFLTQMEVSGKKYLVSDTLKPAPWKFGTETKIIQGYDCMQAYYTTTDERKVTITAWFTAKLPPMLGPEKYNTLPGAVLAVDVNNAERVIVAKKIEIRSLAKNELNVPNDGQKVTSEEFKKIMQEQRNQRGTNGGRFRN